MKESFFIIVLILGLNIWAFSQSIERTSAELPVISDVKSELKKATGWRKRADDQWVKSGNAIPMGEGYGGSYDNFKIFQLREVTVKDKVYSLLIKKKTELAYRYPALEMDVYRQEIIQWFVFDKAKLGKIITSDVEMDKSYGVDLEVISSGERVLVPWVSYGMSNIASEIQTHLKAKPKDLKKALMAVFPVNYQGKKLVRFNFVISYLPEFDKALFDKEYYEADYDVFYKFIRY